MVLSLLFAFLGVRASAQESTTTTAAPDNVEVVETTPEVDSTTTTTVEPDPLPEEEASETTDEAENSDGAEDVPTVPPPPEPVAEEPTTAPQAAPAEESSSGFPFDLDVSNADDNNPKVVIKVTNTSSNTEGFILSVNGLTHAQLYLGPGATYTLETGALECGESVWVQLTAFSGGNTSGSGQRICTPPSTTTTTTTLPPPSNLEAHFGSSFSPSCKDGTVKGTIITGNGSVHDLLVIDENNNDVAFVDNAQPNSSYPFTVQVGEGESLEVFLIVVDPEDPYLGETVDSAMVHGPKDCGIIPVPTTGPPEPPPTSPPGPTPPPTTTPVATPAPTVQPVSNGESVRFETDLPSETGWNIERFVLLMLALVFAIFAFMRESWLRRLMPVRVVHWLS